MGRLAQLVRRIDRANELVGRTVSWLTLAVVAIAAFVALARYGFAWGRVWLQEAYLWLHAITFMLAAGYTLRHDGHVRVDIFYRRAGPRAQAWVNLLGGLFLIIPVVGVLAVVASPYVLESWLTLERSPEAGGLPGLFLLKSVLLGFCLVMLAQALALIGRSVLVLFGAGDALALEPDDRA